MFFQSFNVVYFLLRCSFDPTSALGISKHCTVCWLCVCDSDCVYEPWATIFQCLPLPPSLSLPSLLPMLLLQAETLLICIRDLSLLLISSVYFPTYYLTLKNKQILTDSWRSLPPPRWSLRGCEIKFFIQLSNEWTKDTRHLDISASICGICIRGMEMNSLGHWYHKTDLRWGHKQRAAQHEAVRAGWSWFRLADPIGFKVKASFV